MGAKTWEKLIDLPNPRLRVLVEGNPGKYLPCGGDIVYDSSPDGNNGTVNGEPNWVKSPIRGTCIEFDKDVAHHVDFGDVCKITDDLTVCAWCYPTLAPDGVGRILLTKYWYNGGDPRGWTLGYNYGSGDLMQFTVLNSSGVGSTASKSGFWADHLNQWTHVVGVFKPSTYVRLYVDGVKVAENTTSIISAIAYGTVSLCMGCRADSASQGRWDGMIDEAHIYNRLLSVDDIKELIKDSNKSFSDLKGLWHLDEDGWKSEGSNTYSHFCDEVKVNEVTDNGDGLGYKTTVADCQATAGTYFYDLTNRKLYVHAFDNDDLSNPSTTIVIMMYCWKFFSTDAVNFQPWGDNVVKDGEFEEWDSTTDLTYWGEYISGTSTFNREDDVTKILSGRHCVRLDIDASNNIAYGAIAVSLLPGGKCKLSIWYKNSITGKTSQILLRDFGDNQYLNGSGTWQAEATGILLANATVWTKFELEFDAHASYSEYVFLFANYLSSSSSIWFDKAKIEQQDENRQYMPVVSQDSIPSLDLSVDDIVEGIYKFNFGSFKMLNPGWWDVAADEYVWTNRRVVLKVGGEDMNYEDYINFFVGRISDFYVADENVIFSVKDIRVGTFSQLPVNHYWASNYPNMHEDHEDRPIQLLFGVKTKIPPVCIDTTAGAPGKGGRWKIGDDSYGNYKEITKVVHNGFDVTSSCVVSADKTEFIYNATWDFDFEHDIILVDAKGYVNTENNLLTKSGEISVFLLKKTLKFINDDLDLRSFAYADTVRTYEQCLLLDTDQSSREIFQTLGRSVVAFLTPDDKGRLSFQIYESSTPTGILKFEDKDYDSWKVTIHEAFIRNKVIVKYNFDPQLQVFAIEEEINNDVVSRYGVRKPLELETYLRNQADAASVALAILDMCSTPITMVDTKVGMKAFVLAPAQKIMISRSRAPDPTGAWDEKVFRIRQVGKVLNQERTKIVAMDDLQSLGEGLCSVCYSCQTCYTEEVPCSVCYVCQLCNTDEGGCDLCNTCQLCNTAQSGCISCNLCQVCNDCMSCNDCEACDTCMGCVTCEVCVESEY